MSENKSNRSPHDEEAEADDASVAIIGMSGRFPGAANVDELWQRVSAGDDCLTDLDRTALLESGRSSAVVTAANFVARCGLLDDVEGFDHRFFGIGARDAAIMDPQHRHFLECSWEALESAAVVPEQFDGAIGVFGGCGMNSYLVHNLLTNADLLEQLGWFLLRHTGNDKDFLTNNVAYRLDLRGPAVNVQTACSTSLVAVHLAVQSLLAMECDIALAGGSTIDPTQSDGYLYHDGEILAPDGVCRAFDDASAGTVITSGVAIVALKRLSDALADGDPVLAVIKGSAINNDGSRKVGFLAPSVDGHRDVILEALSVSGLSARDIQLFEAHGTGTAVGDPIEVAAATAAFRSWTDERGFCRITSTKPNVGHLDTAAGTTSLIKVVQALRHKTLPPIANHTAPSSLIDFASSPFVVSKSADAWTTPARRRAGISSLGVGGTNAHVVVEEAPPLASLPDSPPEQVIALSALTKTALAAASARLADHLDSNTGLDLAQVSQTLTRGRRAMPHRRIVTATDLPTAVDLLRNGDRHRSSSAETAGDPVRLGFMFGGGGSQYVGMAAGLDDRFDTFHSVRAEAIELVRATGGVDLSVLLTSSGDSATLRPPTASLPAVFVTAVALARQWMALGAEPQVLLGHSLGEYVAAHLAGVMSLEDAIRLVVIRSSLMERASGADAAMLVVPMAEAEVRAILPATLSLAVVNTIEDCVVAGRLGEIEAFAAEIDQRGTPGSLLPLAAAAHSSLLDPVLDEFAVATRSVDFGPPQIPYPSNLTGTWVTAEQATDPHYWVEHLRGTVRFADCLNTVLGEHPTVLSELGPGQALSSFARRSTTRPVAAIPTLRHPDHEIDDTAFTMHAFAQQWLWGIDVDLASLAGDPRPRLRLPTYPFEHERCWIEPGQHALSTTSSSSRDSAPSGPERIDDLDQACWTVTWSDVDPPHPPATPASTWTVFGDRDDELVELLASELRVRGVASSTAVGDRDLDASGLEGGVVVIAPSGQPSYENSVTRWFEQTTAIVRQLGASAEPCRLIIVTRRALAAGDVANRPVDAMALGVGLVAAREYLNLTTRVVDIDAITLDIAAVVDDVLGDGPQVVAHRGTARLAPDVRPTLAPRPDASEPTFRDGGTYLVTGALGGVGHVLASHLARTHRAHLVVTTTEPIPEADSRSRWLDTHAYDDPTSRRIRQLMELERFGTEVTVVVADLGDPDSVRRAMAEIDVRVGRLAGAVHAAGTLRDRLIELATLADFTTVLAAKAHGALVLADELASRDADLLLLISSTSTVLAPEGQASYVGANAVLDSMAGRRGDLRVATINFGLWAEVGIASALARRSRLSLTEGDPVDHPVFSERSVRSDGSTTFTGRIGASANWVVDEHRTVDGVAIYPGTGHVHLMVSAAQLAGVGEFELVDLELLTPLIVPDDHTVTVRAEVSAEGRIEISSDGGEGVSWMLHSHAGIRPTTTDAEPCDVLAEFASFESESVDLLADQRAHMLFGPRWGSVIETGRGDGVVTGRLQLSTNAAEAARWSPHPALLDLVTAVGLAVAPRGAEPALYVPARYRRIRVHGPVPDEIVVRAVEADGSSVQRRRVDLVAVDSTGRRILDIDGLELVAVADHILLDRTVQEPVHSASGPPGSVVGWADAFGLRPDEGAELVERLLAGPHDRLIGSTIALDDLIASVGHADVADDASAARSTDGGAASLEGALTSMWSDLLGLGNIDPDDDFFDLGGHSLIAIRLMARIHRDFGVRLELSAIFDAPTVLTLSERLREENAEIDARFAPGTTDDSPTATTNRTTSDESPRAATERHLVRISRGGSGRPLYVVHGAGGNVLFLGGFGRAMATSRPVYGFEAHGINGHAEPDASIEAMADRYVAELRAHDPGPYLLGGYSGGGIVAIEMARRLESLGAQVDGVVLFDSPVGRISLGRWVHARHLLRTLITRGPRPVVPLVTSRLQGTTIGRKVFFRGRTSVHERSHQVNYDDMLAHGFNDLFDHFTSVCDGFTPGDYAVDAVLVKAQLRWPLMSPDYGWGNHLSGTLSTFVAPGDHESMFHGPNVEVLVAELEPHLRRLDSSES